MLVKFAENPYIMLTRWGIPADLATHKTHTPPKKETLSRMPARYHRRHVSLSKPLRLHRRQPTKSSKNMSSRVTITAPTYVIFGGHSKSSPQTFKFEGWERCYGASSKPNRPRGKELSDRSPLPFVPVPMLWLCFSPVNGPFNSCLLFIVSPTTH